MSQLNRLVTCFANLKQLNKTALVPYIAAGDPSLDMTVPLMHAMVESGANILELGVPFSDPMADGPVIQRATERALKFDTSLTDVFEMVRSFRQQDTNTPIILMGYLNPIEVMGYELFITEAVAVGVDGVLTVDLPPEEAQSFTSLCSTHGLDPIYLIAPTTSPERMRMINNFASGFVYYVSIKGVTGAANIDSQEVSSRVDSIRKYIELPVGVGFGIKDAATAVEIAKNADAVVIGSAIINLIESNLHSPSKIIQQISEFLSDIRQALDS
ncbi:Tryptophan synthase alpha chain [hydrothermal vent metagenome]|uniref:tryptophan synthase n=1 Tax=hydrothermal vent metagenome TaxID=652676 RepID=A0A3B0ZV18_9ZZZZ